MTLSNWEYRDKRGEKFTFRKVTSKEVREIMAKLKRVPWKEYTLSVTS